MEWTLGGNGDHPPIHSVIDYNVTGIVENCTTQQVFSHREIVPNGIEYTTEQMILEGLQPEAMYNIRLHAVNKQGVDPNVQYLYLCGVLTSGEIFLSTY